ncbi:MAG: polysaccharide deacetylase family protein [Gammaproteobacteria bacterium]|nr:polysaccharide deacetylase family protein [Gammaproteobacteria bacterium]
MDECDTKSEAKAGRSGLKRRAADAFCAVGGLRVVRWMTRRIPRILLYHRFGSDSEGRRTSADAFEQQVMFLKRHCHVMAMAELGEMLRAGNRIPDNAAVITVDDGYRDFYTQAFPVLSRHNVPATFYVTTGFVDRKLWLWPDKVAYVLENTGLSQWPLSIEGRERYCSSADMEGRRKLWVEICQYCLSLGEQEKNRFLADLAQRLDVRTPEEPPGDYAPVSWQQLREMSQSGIEIGAHTVTHARLVKIPEAQLADEIVGCKRRIEEMIGQPVLSFSYPNGGRYDYDIRVKRMVDSAGYQTAAVAFPEAGTADRFEVGRYSIGCDMREFQIVLSFRGAFDSWSRADAPRVGFEF